MTNAGMRFKRNLRLQTSFVDKKYMVEASISDMRSTHERLAKSRQFIDSIIGSGGFLSLVNVLFISRSFFDIIMAIGFVVLFMIVYLGYIISEKSDEKFLKNQTKNLENLFKMTAKEFQKTNNPFKPYNKILKFFNIITTYGFMILLSIFVIGKLMETKNMNKETIQVTKTQENMQKDSITNLPNTTELLKEHYEIPEDTSKPNEKIEDKQ